MSRRAQIAWAAVLIGALAAGAAWLALGAAPSPPARSERAAPGADRDLKARALEAVRRAARRERRRRARAERPVDEPGPRGGRLRAHDRRRAQAEPVARAFFSAFSRYERGEVDAAALRATATPALARALLSAPPRPARRGGRAAPARLGRLELVASGRGRSRGVARIELVGTVRRRGRREPIAIELRRRRGGWLVAGLGL